MNRALASNSSNVTISGDESLHLNNSKAFRLSMSSSSCVWPHTSIERGEIVRMFAAASVAASRSRLLPSTSQV